MNTRYPHQVVWGSAVVVPVFLVLMLPRSAWTLLSAGRDTPLLPQATARLQAASRCRPAT